MEQRARQVKRNPGQSATLPIAAGGRRSGAFLLVLAGLLAGAAAGLLGSAEQLHPSGAWIAQRFARVGVQPGMLGLAAAICLGAAALLASMGRLGRRFSDSSRRGEELFEKVGGQVVALRRSLHDFRAEVVWLREAMTGLAEVVRDHVSQNQIARAAAATKDDAVFRVAASLDQLGARLEDRLQRTESGQSEHLIRLEALLEHLGQELEHGLRDLVSYGSQPDENGAAYELEAPEHPDRAALLQHTVEYGNAFEEPYEPADDDLHIEVDLEGFDAQHEEGAQTCREDDPGEQDEPEATDPALFETSLGLLDAFDEYGAYQPERSVQPEELAAPLPGPAPQDQSAAAGPSEPPPPAQPRGPEPPAPAPLRLSPRRPRGQG